MSILALDVGSKRIGVAVADPGGSFAMPLETIARTNLAADVARIVEIAADRQVCELVVGDPVTLSGERGIASRHIDAFVERLTRTFSGTIHRQDERLTTAAATKTLIGADVSRKRRKEVVDAMAAALILETFLRRRAARP
jgi:putative Holliday junction resolvase